MWKGKVSEDMPGKGKGKVRNELRKGVGKVGKCARRSEESEEIEEDEERKGK